MTIDLKSMTSAELLKLKNAVEKALDNAKSKEMDAARKAAEKAVAEYGLTLADVAGGNAPAKGRPGRKKGKAKSIVSAKYRNPDDASQTWSGRGRRPDWVRTALEAGKDLNDLMI